MGMGFAPTWLRQVSHVLHMTTLVFNHWNQSEHNDTHAWNCQQRTSKI